MLLFSFSLPVTVHGKGALGDAARNVTSDVGNAMSDVGNAVSDVLDPNGNETAGGPVNDSDGIIGNEKNESETEVNPTDNEKSMGWIGLVIAILIVLIAVILIVLLVPRKKKR
jgi:L-aminopeptidase/D-esterase-like protein